MHPGDSEHDRNEPDIRPLVAAMIQTTDSLVQALPVDLVYMCLPDPGARTASLHPLYEGSDSFRMSLPTRFVLAGSLLEEILDGGGPRIINRPFTGSFSALEMSLSRRIGSAVLVPLEGSAGPLGTVILASLTEGSYVEAHLDVIKPLVAPLARAVETELAAVT
ncbi:MAG: GAF domain-containing protein [Deltaproteobacteria bacterium]|nr:GAF domain-containing protein [Deltaproteobacteria bacterium]